MHPVYPNYSDFNYVIAVVNIEGKEYFLDATSRLPFGILPVKCYNGQGWKASLSNPDWVNLKNGKHYTTGSC